MFDEEPDGDPHGECAAEIHRLQAARAELEAQLSALLPGPYYMNLPDGGSVTLIEQLRRMAADAARWRREAGDLHAWLDTRGIPREDSDYCSSADYSLRGRVEIAVDRSRSNDHPRCSVCKDKDEGCSKNYSGGWVGTPCPN